MLQVMLCAICMMSAALLYYDFVIIPRQNRELVEDLKSHFPEVFPPGGGSPTQKEEQAGREPEVSLTSASYRVSIRMFGVGLQSRRVASIIRYCRAARKNRSIICGGITRETTTSMEVCSSRQTVFWENRGI